MRPRGVVYARVLISALARPSPLFVSRPRRETRMRCVFQERYRLGRLLLVMAQVVWATLAFLCASIDCCSMACLRAKLDRATQEGVHARQKRKSVDGRRQTAPTASTTYERNMHRSPRPGRSGRRQKGRNNPPQMLHPISSDSVTNVLRVPTRNIVTTCVHISRSVTGSGPGPLPLRSPPFLLSGKSAVGNAADGQQMAEGREGLILDMVRGAHNLGLLRPRRRTLYYLLSFVCIEGEDEGKRGHAIWAPV
jgi:hypothetical protein